MELIWLASFERHIANCRFVGGGNGSGKMTVVENMVFE